MAVSAIEVQAAHPAMFTRTANKRLSRFLRSFHIHVGLMIHNVKEHKKVAMEAT